MEAAIAGSVATLQHPVYGLDAGFVAATSTLYTYRDCYLECSARGYSRYDCTQACQGLFNPKDDVTGPGGCTTFWDCFTRNFQVPAPVLRAPGEVTGALKWLVVGVVALVVLDAMRLFK